MLIKGKMLIESGELKSGQQHKEVEFFVFIKLCQLYND